MHVSALARVAPLVLASVGGVVVLLGAVLLPGSVAGAAPGGAKGGLADHAAPPGMKALEDPSGGRLLVGELGRPRTTQAAFQAGVRGLAGYFDAAPRLVGVVRSTDGTVTLGAFTTTLSAANVSGVVYTIFAAGTAGGSSRVGVLFDRAERFPRSYPALVARFRETLPPTGGEAQGGGGADAGALQSVVARDHTLAALIPASYTVGTCAQGMLLAFGPEKQTILIRYVANLLDPRGGRAVGRAPVPYTSDAAAAMIAVVRSVDGPRKPDRAIRVEHTRPMPLVPGTVTVAALEGSETYDGVPRRFRREVYVTPLDGRGQWNVQINELSAPTAIFDRDIGALAAAYRSYRYDPSAHAQAIVGTANAYAAHNDAVFQSSMASARAAQDRIDRSTAGFVHYLNGTDVMQHDPSGARGTLDAGLAQAIVDSDPRNFRLVPVSEYRKGVDY